MDPLPHPRSRDFVWQDHPGPYRRLAAAEVQAFDREGFVVVEDAFDADTLREVRELIDPVEAEIEDFVRAQPDGKLFIARAGEITFVPHLVLRSPRLATFCASPIFQDVCHDLIGPDVRLYWDQAVYKKPGTEVPFPWHQDNGYTFVVPQQYLTCWVALTDASEDNGCPWVIPGLHRGGTLRHRTSDLGFVCMEDPGSVAIPVPLRAGSFVAFSSLTPHATGPNRTSGVRKAYIVQFAPDGALVYARGPAGDAPDAEPAPANDPRRQFPVLRAGRPVAPPGAV